MHNLAETGAYYYYSAVRRRKPAWPLGAPRRLRLSPLHHCNNNNNMLLPQPGCAASAALAGTVVHKLMGMSYQGLVAGGNLLAEWRSEARVGLATLRPPPAAARLVKGGACGAAPTTGSPFLHLAAPSPTSQPGTTAGYPPSHHRLPLVPPRCPFSHLEAGRHHRPPLRPSGRGPATTSCPL